MHNIDFDPLTHRVSMPLETFLGVIRDAGKSSEEREEEPTTEQEEVPCPNCKKSTAYHGQHFNGHDYGCKWVPR